MGVKIEAGTKALHERDCAALAARDPAGTSTTAQRGENRTDEDPNQDRQQLGVISDPLAQAGGRGKHPLADRDVRNDVVHQMRCRICHPSPSARRAYASGLAGERHDAVQPAGVASDPEEAPGEHATIEERSKLLLDEARHLPLVILLGRQKGF